MSESIRACTGSWGSSVDGALGGGGSSDGTLAAGGSVGDALAAGSSVDGAPAPASDSLAEGEACAVSTGASRVIVVSSVVEELACSDCGDVAETGCGFTPKFVEARIAWSCGLVMLLIAPLRLYW